MSRSPIVGTLAQLWKLSLVIPLVMPVALLAAGDGLTFGNGVCDDLEQIRDIEMPRSHA